MWARCLCSIHPSIPGERRIDATGPFVGVVRRLSASPRTRAPARSASRAVGCGTSPTVGPRRRRTGASVADPHASPDARRYGVHRLGPGGGTCPPRTAIRRRGDSARPPPDTRGRPALVGRLIRSPVSRVHVRRFRTPRPTARRRRFGRTVNRVAPRTSGGAPPSRRRRYAPARPRVRRPSAGRARRPRRGGSGA